MVASVAQKVLLVKPNIPNGDIGGKYWYTSNLLRNTDKLYMLFWLELDVACKCIILFSKALFDCLTLTSKCCPELINRWNRSKYNVTPKVNAETCIFLMFSVPRWFNPSVETIWKQKVVKILIELAKKTEISPCVEWFAINIKFSNLNPISKMSSSFVEWLATRFSVGLKTSFDSFDLKRALR